jgi:hypothetical protein
MVPIRLDSRISKLEQYLDATEHLPWSVQEWRLWPEHARVHALCHLSPDVRDSAETAPALKSCLETLSDMALSAVIAALMPVTGATQ